MPITRIRNFFIVLCAALTLAGCASTSQVESDLGLADAPDWVNQGINGGELKAHDGRYYYGFGFAPPMGARSLQMSAADNRARADLAQSLEATIKSRTDLDDHASSAAGEQSADSSASQNISARTDMLLRSSVIVARWRDPETGTLYSLAELDYKRHQSQTDAE